MRAAAYRLGEFMDAPFAGIGDCCALSPAASMRTFLTGSISAQIILLIDTGDSA
jgi:hypothetical protein